MQYTGCSGFPGGNCGIFTSTTGTAPNRQFNVEWRVVHFADTTTSANFSVVFYENDSSFFDVFYGATSDNGLDETSGVQASPSRSGDHLLMRRRHADEWLESHLHVCGRWPEPDPDADGNRYTGWLHGQWGYRLQRSHAD